MPSMRYLTFSYSQNLTVRDNTRFRQIVKADLFREFWGERFNLTSDSVEKVQNNVTGWKIASSVGGTGTGERGDRVLVDDPNNVRESESDVIRSATNQWFNEVVPTRLNHPSKSAIIVIQQRTNEEDVSGIILAKELGYEHLMVPMEFDTGRMVTTSIGWTDPRGFDDDGEPLAGRDLDDADGVLAWPERYPPNECVKLKKQLGPYAWCTPAESPILMADLSMKPIGDIEVGDQIIGFTAGDTSKKPHVRRRLVQTDVKAISRSVQTVVKITFESGRTARCTADHKWYTGRNDPGHPTYAPAKVGRKLMRVCDPQIQELTNPEDIRDAGWLAGFFDGEGSCSRVKRHPEYDAGYEVSFAQGAGRNIILCEKLERVLDKFGFCYGMKEYDRQDRDANSPSTHKSRHYYIKPGNGKRVPSLPTYQKFLHVIRPHKWRDRLAQAPMGSRFISEEEKVISIEPDGYETVYGLTTGTGNYVVWGLASSNSGQFQQSPQPRGGGIFKREWWQEWPPAEWPDEERLRRSNPNFEYIVASLDTAFTEKEENDYCALTIWGVFRGGMKGRLAQRFTETVNGDLMIDMDRSSHILLVEAWQKRLDLHGPPEDGMLRMAQRYCNYCKAKQGTLHTPRCPFYQEQRQDRWGVVEWTVDTCRRRHVDKLLIEAKASGIDVAKELARLYSNDNWGVELIDPRGDKVARAYSVQHLFSNGIIHAPVIEGATLTRPAWAELLISQMEHFPKTRYKDLTDSAVHALRHLRDIGIAVRTEEADRQMEEEFTYQGPILPLYDT